MAEKTTEKSTEKPAEKPDERSIPRMMYENVVGTPAQNEAAQKRLDNIEKRHPDSVAAKISKVRNAIIGRKAGGSVKSASARADGCAQRGKTRA